LSSGTIRCRCTCRVSCPCVACDVPWRLLPAATHHALPAHLLDGVRAEAIHHYVRAGKSYCVDNAWRCVASYRSHRRRKRRPTQPRSRAWSLTCRTLPRYRPAASRRPAISRECFRRPQLLPIRPSIPYSTLSTRSTRSPLNAAATYCPIHPRRRFKRCVLRCAAGNVV